MSWWSQRCPGCPPLQEPPNDPQITDKTTTLTDVTPNLVAGSHIDYDPATPFNNVRTVTEYDYGSGSIGSEVRHTQYTYVTDSSYTAVPVHLCSLIKREQVFDPVGVQRSRTTYEYDNYNQSAPDNFHAPLTPRSNITGLDGAYNATHYVRGNVTATTRNLLDTSGNITGSFTGYAQYDVAGNVVKVLDPRSTSSSIIATAFDFGDAYGYPDSNAESNELPLPVELPSSVHTYAFPTKVTNALNQSAFAQYDYYLSKPVNTKDANGIVSRIRYDNDLLDRPSGVDVGMFTGSQLQNHTSFTYSDSSHMITTQRDQVNLNDGVLTSTLLYDGFGRTTETRINAPEGTIYTTQQYDAMGRLKRSYNPYLTGPTNGYTDTAYDGLNRVSSVTTADGAIAMTSYSGNATTVTDQAGKKRRSITDGLGRLIRVDEPDSSGNLDAGNPPQPVQPTSYVYDVLDDLAKVTQGAQSRYFMYDSLRRLIRARNPEQNINNNLNLTDPVTNNSQWCVRYDYDANSNLSTRIDARNITTNYGYDALNRVATRGYVGDPQNTPGVNYFYDNQSLPGGAPALTRGSSVGRLVAVTYGAGSAGNYQGYDALGRVNVSYQQTDSQNYGFGYNYNLASEMTKETYPSGRQVITEYDSAGRAAGIRAAAVYYAGAMASDSTNRIQYAPQGAVSIMKLGNGKWEHTNYNNRLQPTQIGLGISGTDSSLLKLDYTYSNSDPGIHDNNGNVRTQKITIGSTVINQTYTYDGLNRLQTATETGGWMQTYDCDRFGNRAVRAGSYIPTPALTPQSANSTDFSAFNQGNNRIQVNGYGYDAAGNLKNDPTTPANAILYDAENRQVSFTKGGTTTYSYDGDGHRVKKIAGSVTTVFVYNASGQLTAEYTNDTTPPVGGGGTSYLTSDHLGSTRLVMKSDGTTVKARYDYLPFGDEIPSNIGSRGGVTGYGGADSTKQKFTQKERDNESGLDYFGARYYSSAPGRFMRPDEGFIGQYENDPQSWNLYIYARNNPLLFVDPSGHDYIVFNDDGGEMRIKDKDLGKYKLIAGNGTTAVFMDTNGKTWTGTFVDAPVENSVNVQAPAAEIQSDVMGEYLREYGNWIQKHSREDGMVLDPTQSPIGRSLWPQYIDPNDFTIVDYWEQTKELEKERLEGLMSVCATSAARQAAAKLGGEIVKKFKSSGIGQAVGRSGGHGEAFKKAGAELIRRANAIADREMREAMKIEGQRLIDRGKSISHK